MWHVLMCLQRETIVPFTRKTNKIKKVINENRNHNGGRNISDKKYQCDYLKCCCTNIYPGPVHPRIPATPNFPLPHYHHKQRSNCHYKYLKCNQSSHCRCPWHILLHLHHYYSLADVDAVTDKKMKSEKERDRLQRRIER